MDGIHNPKVGQPNIRETAWEVHPVMGLEVLPKKPATWPSEKVRVSVRAGANYISD